MPYLQFEQQSRSLGPGVLSVGSGAEAGWRIREYDLLRLHALFLIERDGRVVVKRGSPDAPVAVNGVELTDDRQALVYGDSIQLGSIQFQFLEAAHEQTDTGEGYLRDTRRDRLFKLNEATRIGRDADSGLQLLEPEVARRHAEIRFDGSGFVIIPRKEGVTLINGVRISSPTRLEDGDIVSIGRTTLQFSTTPPPKSALEDGLRRRADPHVASAPKPFGSLERQRRLRRRSRKRAGRVAVVALAAAALIAGLVTAYERSLASTRGSNDAPSATSGPVTGSGSTAPR
jgi:hypothetical protein